MKENKKADTGGHRRAHMSSNISTVHHVCSWNRYLIICIKEDGIAGLPPLLLLVENNTSLRWMHVHI